MKQNQMVNLPHKNSKLFLIKILITKITKMTLTLIIIIIIIIIITTTITLASGAQNALPPKPPVPFILADSAHCAPLKLNPKSTTEID